MAEDRRIPSLDGIRGVLLIIVMSAHTLGTRNFPLSRDAIPMEGLAYTAMRTFFIISGFLITGILLNELNRRGSVNLMRFYFKRTFRIFPAYYAFLVIIAIAATLGFLETRPGDMLQAVTYTSNYNPDAAWHVGHTWSLSVEEQFYLIWPAVLLMAGTGRAVWLLAGLILLTPAWRILLQAVPEGAYGLGLWQAGRGHTFDTTADIIAIGCLLAILRTQLWSFAPYRKLIESKAAMLAVLVYVVLVPLTPDLAYQFEGSTRYLIFALYEAIGVPALNISIALLVDWAMRNPASSVGRALNRPFLMKLGVISYSTYLWQQVFLNRHEDMFFNVFPLNVILALAFGWLSFRFIETPWLVLRERIDARRRPRAEVPMPAPEPVLAAAEVPSIR
jgi:peptidoglycan/LPS O-acetylase OafA/YrhL